MKFTNKQIATTKSNVLRTILTSMKPQIQTSIDMCIAHEEAMTKRPASEFGKECIEATLLFDLYRSVVSYTKDDDQVKNFTASISIKGNFEIHGNVVRDGVEYRFVTEAIIADGMINRRHVRYITKTNLPNARNMNEANKIKEIIKSNNKRQRMLDHIRDLNKYKTKSLHDVEVMSKYTRQDWINKLGDGLLENNWESFSKEDQENGYHWSTKEEYNTFLNEANERAIERRMERLQWAMARISQLDVSINKEQKKLDKFLAL